MSTPVQEQPPAMALNCPIPSNDASHVLLAHGGGGRLMRDLIANVFRPQFDNPLLGQEHDGAVFTLGGARLALTTDSHVVEPLFFPGGDIGTLAINGTVNDLAMCGARPLYLTAGFILEEGVPMDVVRRVACSMREAAHTAGVSIVTGDTKVVDRGKADGLYINTAGVGLVEHSRAIGPSQVRAGDAILISGDIGRHGVAVMARRQGLELDAPIDSDCASVAAAVLDLLESGVEVHCLRDLTRGGLAAALVEIAETAGVELALDEGAIAVDPTVRGVCEVLGLDPVHIACEGRFVAFVAAEDVDRAHEVLSRHGDDSPVCRIGRVVSGTVPGQIRMRTSIGAERILDLPAGDPLPRIC